MASATFDSKRIRDKKEQTISSSKSKLSTSKALEIFGNLRKPKEPPEIVSSAKRGRPAKPVLSYCARMKLSYASNQKLDCVKIQEIQHLSEDKTRLKKGGRKAGREK
jgi:hypothetical protein